MVIIYFQRFEKTIIRFCRGSVQRNVFLQTSNEKGYITPELHISVKKKSCLGKLEFGSGATALQDMFTHCHRPKAKAFYSMISVIY
jgi:hypothetical protein